MKNVCVVTGSRAEYGIMRALLLKLNKEKNIKLDVVVTAMHLEEKYGNTYKQIEEDGLNIIRKIPLNLENTSKKCVSRSLAILTTGLSELFEEVKYDLIIILGDRYEMLPVVMEYKAKEVALQNLIDEVMSKIAFAVSEHVKIETGNPFFQTGHDGCASGGTCNCSL